MLTKIRDRHVKKIMWGLVFIIVPSFVIWGGVSYLNEKRSKIVGQIAKRNINIQEFTYYYDMARVYLTLTKSDEAKINPKEIEKLAWQYALLSWKIKQDRIKVSDKQLVQFIKDKLFGKTAFNEQVYTRFLRYHLGIETKTFEDYSRKFLAIEALFAKYVKAEVTDQEVKDGYLKDNQTAQLSLVSIPYDKFKTTVDEVEAKNFYEANKNLFTEGPKVKFKYLLIEKNNQELANKVSEKLKTAKDLSEIGKEFSLEVKETGLVGLQEPVAGLGPQTAINSLAYNLPDAKPSKLLEASSGMICLQRLDMRESYVPEFTQIKDKVIAYVSSEKMKKSADEYAKQMIQKAKTIAELSGSAAAENVSVKELKDVKYYEPIGDMGINEQASKLIFNAKSGDIINQTFSDPTGVYVIGVNSLSGFDEKDFIAKKDAVGDQITRQKEMIERIKFFSKLNQEANMKVFAINSQE